MTATVKAVKSFGHIWINNFYPKENCNLALDTAKYVSWNDIMDRLSWAKRLMFFVSLTTEQFTLATDGLCW